MDLSTNESKQLLMMVEDATNIQDEVKSAVFRLAKKMKKVKIGPSGAKLCRLVKATDGSYGFHCSYYKEDSLHKVKNVVGGFPAQLAGLENKDIILR